MFSTLVISVIVMLAPYLPYPHDKDGLGLRIRLGREGPFLQHERLERIPMDLMLINFSKERREHDVFTVAAEIGDLKFSVVGPDGKGLGQIGGPYAPRGPFTVMNKLQPGDCYWDHFEGFGSFDQRLYQTGRYRIVGSMKINGKELSSPPIGFEVVRIADESVLVSQKLPSVGLSLRPGEKQLERAAVEQIRVGDHVWLVYRRWEALRA